MFLLFTDYSFDLMNPSVWGKDSQALFHDNHPSPIVYWDCIGEILCKNSGNVFYLDSSSEAPAKGVTPHQYGHEVVWSKRVHMFTLFHSQSFKISSLRWKKNTFASMNPSIFYQHFLLPRWQKTIETDHLIVWMIICLCVDVGCWMDGWIQSTIHQPPLICNILKGSEWNRVRRNLTGKISVDCSKISSRSINHQLSF